MTETTKKWAQSSSDKDLKRIKKDMIKTPLRWSKAAKTAITTEIKQRGLKVSPKKERELIIPLTFHGVCSK